MVKPRLVVKVGTSTLLEGHEMPTTTFDYVAASIHEIREKFDVVLVTSGATGFGVRQVGLEKRPQDLSQLQALASIGQVGLMERWSGAMGDYPVGQVLVTARELANDVDSSLLLSTFDAMWSMDTLPIVNENDAITNEEFTFGDNDKLSALVAVSLKADYLVLLTDQDGLFANFGTDDQAHIATIKLADAGKHLTASQSAHGTGGMASKLLASGIALKGGVQPFIAHARTENVISQVLSGESGTKLI